MCIYESYRVKLQYNQEEYDTVCKNIQYKEKDAANYHKYHINFVCVS